MRWAAILALLALAAADTAVAHPTCPPVAKPQWVRAPGSQDFSRYYPTHESPVPIEGHVLLNCVADRAGRLRRCEVTQETPPARDFGKAALSLARLFRIARPGCPSAGQRVTIPIHFVPGD